MKHYKTALAAIVSTALMATTPAWAGSKENDAGADTSAGEIGQIANSTPVTFEFEFSGGPIVSGFIGAHLQQLEAAGIPTDNVVIIEEER